MESIIIVGILYLILLNITGFAAMGIDKRRAVMKRWRVREKHLFLVALLGGSAGSILGMHHFRHKTKHPRFVYGMPLILILQVLALIYLIKLRT
jgi:uncharacterized membrane protein YsdA (DUF1294 family)